MRLTLKDIIISFSIFLGCLIIALGSQVISPTTINAAQIQSTNQAAFKTIDKTQSNLQSFELDPEDPNPTLFIMAADKSSPSQSNASKMSQPLKTRVTKTGLKITDIIIGEGEKAIPGKSVSVNYRGTLEDGNEFDSSYDRGPFTFPLGSGKVIKGWEEGVEGMKVGGKRELVIPSELGYGSRGIGPIPPNATLLFEIELLEVN
tara:strand:- start:543 stop:1154 length:612 start_codon:yes stop_codon:yes gene_type:complete